MKLRSHLITAKMPALGVSARGMGVVVALVCVEWLGWVALGRSAGERLAGAITIDVVGVSVCV